MARVEDGARSASAYGIVSATEARVARAAGRRSCAGIRLSSRAVKPNPRTPEEKKRNRKSANAPIIIYRESHPDGVEHHPRSQQYVAMFLALYSFVVLLASRVVLDAVGMRLPQTTIGAVFALLWFRFLLRVRGFGFTARDESRIPAHDLLRLDACASVAETIPYADALRGAVFHTRHLLLALARARPGASRARWRSSAATSGRAARRPGRAHRRSWRSRAKPPNAPAPPTHVPACSRSSARPTA